MTMRDRVKELCKNKKVSLNKVEQELGVATGYLSKLDKSTPNSAKLQKIADYFNVSVEYLMTGKEDEIPTLFTEQNMELVTLFDQLDKDTQSKMIENMKKLVEAQKILKGE